MLRSNVRPEPKDENTKPTQSMTDTKDIKK